jgi:hypothetical protein
MLIDDDKSGESLLSILLYYLYAMFFVFDFLRLENIVNDLNSLNLLSLSEQLTGLRVIIDQPIQQLIGIIWIVGKLELLGNSVTISFQEDMEQIFMEQLLSIDEPGHKGVSRPLLKGHSSFFETGLDLCKHIELLENAILNSNELFVTVVVVISSLWSLLSQFFIFSLSAFTSLKRDGGGRVINFRFVGRE